MTLNQARALLPRGVPECRLAPFYPPLRRLQFVATTRTAHVLAEAVSISLPPSPSASSMFSDDDGYDGQVRYLGGILSPLDVRSMSLFQLTLDRLLARYGPLVDTETAAHLLAYKSAVVLTTTLRSNDRVLPIRLIVPPGRRKGFLSVEAVAGYLSELGSRS